MPANATATTTAATRRAREAVNACTKRALEKEAATRCSLALASAADQYSKGRVALAAWPKSDKVHI
jgi:hypothetical protein